MPTCCSRRWPTSPSARRREIALTQVLIFPTTAMSPPSHILRRSGRGTAVVPGHPHCCDLVQPPPHLSSRKRLLWCFLYATAAVVAAVCTVCQIHTCCVITYSFSLPFIWRRHLLRSARVLRLVSPRRGPFILSCPVDGKPRS